MLVIRILAVPVVRLSAVHTALASEWLAKVLLLVRRIHVLIGGIVGIVVVWVVGVRSMLTVLALLAVALLVQMRRLRLRLRSGLLLAAQGWVGSGVSTLLGISISRLCLIEGLISLGAFKNVWG